MLLRADPDTLTHDQAMADTEHISKWRAAAETEIRTLEQMGMWIEVPQTEVTSKILPGTWAYRRKRSPDGEIKKYKARYCIRGDLQEGVFNTYSPLVSWSTVRVLLAFALTFDGPLVQLISLRHLFKPSSRIQFGFICPVAFDPRKEMVHVSALSRVCTDCRLRPVCGSNTLETAFWQSA
jgi:hypothetical protein